MKKIIINKKGILNVNPIWVSLNNGNYKLHFSNPIELESNQVDNVIKVRDWSFIYSKEFVLEGNESNTVVNIRLNSFEKGLRIGVFMVAFLVILYLMMPWRFFQTNVLFYILGGSIALCLVLSLMFTRKNYVELDD